MSIADLLDYSLKEVPQQSEIRTETVEPNNATTDASKVFKFTIRNVGFLEGTSMLTFKLKNRVGASGAQDLGRNDMLRLNLWSGALSCIKNAHLRIGDYEVQNAQDVDRISALLNMNKSVLQRRNVLGHYLGNSMELKTLDVADATRYGAAANLISGRGQIVLENDNSGVDFGNFDDADGAKVNSLAINSDKSINEKYGIPLSMIFPCLKGRSLPLFLFTDYNIQLEFEFNFADKYCYDLKNKPTMTGVPTVALPYSPTDPATTAESGSPYSAGIETVGINECELVVDYMLPPSSVVNNFIEQTTKAGGYRFEFPEIAVVKKKLNAVGQSKEIQEVEHRLGQTGKEVHNVVMAKRFVDYNKREGSIVTRTGQFNQSAQDATIYNVNCENISLGALVVSATYAPAGTPRYVTSIDIVNQKIVLNSNTASGTTGGAAQSIKFVNPNYMGLARKILQHNAIHGIDEEEYNVEVNGLDLYPQFVHNNASHYNNMSMVMNEDLVLPRPMYYTDVNAQRQRLVPMDDGLLGQYKPLGADMTNGNGGVVGSGTTIMSGSPLIFKYKRKPRINGSGDGSIQANNLKGKAPDFRGEMDIDYYITHSRVCTIKKLPKGTSVMVSS